MPRFVSRTYHVEAVQWTGYTAAIPMTFAEAIIPGRTGMACDVRCGTDIRSCAIGDWLVRGMDGRIEVLSNGVFDQRYEQIREHAAGRDYAGITATFHGDPAGIPEEQPPYVDWFNMRFYRAKPMPVPLLSVSDIEKIRLNPHFTVTDPSLVLEEASDPVTDLEPKPATSPGRGNTLTLNRKG